VYCSNVGRGLDDLVGVGRGSPVWGMVKEGLGEADGRVIVHSKEKGLETAPIESTAYTSN
jgi:hypothetical protein